jgi:hypothetical protein
VLAVGGRAAAAADRADARLAAPVNIPVSSREGPPHEPPRRVLSESPL